MWAEPAGVILKTVSAMAMRFVLPTLFLLLAAGPAGAQVGADLNISPKRVVFEPG